MKNLMNLEGNAVVAKDIYKVALVYTGKSIAVTAGLFVVYHFAIGFLQGMQKHHLETHIK